MRYLSSWALLLLSALAMTLVGCGGGSSQGPNPNPAPQPVSISITPSSTALLVNQGFTFQATVKNASNTAVIWSVQETGGGTISNSPFPGLYFAPWTTGTYHVVATSVADPSKSATATVDVAAQFGFLQEYTAGDATPFSVTPVIGIFNPDGSFSTEAIIDSGTGKPITAPLMDLFLSSDALKGVSTMVESDGGSGWYFNIYTADSAGSVVTGLTTGEYDGEPQFTPDNAQIIYTKASSEQAASDIWMMNADGSDQHVILSASLTNTGAWHPTVSLDGSRIAAEIIQLINEQWYDGIAVMNPDGSNLMQLTGNLDCPYGWDEMPSFTHDGQDIVFSRFCYSGDALTESIYTINVEGIGLKLLYGDGTPNIINCDPLPVADKIVFASNKDNPGTLKFDLYSIKPDGSELTRLTTNALYDAFNALWYWSPYESQASLHSPMGKRMEKLKALQQRRH